MFVLLGLLLAPVNRVAAQESSDEKVQTTIEIKDGKVFLNGEEIATLEDANAPIAFKRNRDGSSNTVWSYDGDDVELRKELRVRRGHGDNTPRVRGMPRVHGFMSDGEEKVEVFNIERFAETLQGREFEERFDIEVMANRMAEGVVNMESARAMNLLSNRSMTKEGIEADRRSREIARMIRREDGDVDELQAELDELLSKAFDEKQNGQQQRIDEMREKLADLKERLAQRKRDREEIIGKRKNELLGRSSRYDW